MEETNLRALINSLKGDIITENRMGQVIDQEKIEIICKCYGTFKAMKFRIVHLWQINLL